MEEKALQYNVIYKYHCRPCSKGFSYKLTFEQWRDDEFVCPICQKKLKFLTSQDIREGQNVGFLSVDTVTKQNIRRIGNEQWQMQNEQDPIIKHRIDSKKNAKKENWWRSNLKDPSKPLPLDKIKDVNKYITDGTID